VLRDARSLCSDGGRYIDYGVRLYTVAADPSGDEVLPGRPRVVAVRDPEEFGAIWDCRLMRWHDQSANPVVWFASEEQRRLILHGPELPDKLLCRGAEGAGKTRGVVAPWMLARAILDLAGQNVEIGGTAPTMRRLETLRLALFEKAPADWYTWRQRDCLMRMPIGVDIRLVSTHRTSEAEGSPVQGFDWAAHAGDELQDQLHAVDDIYARGRRAPLGRYRQCGSASVKDTNDYRSFEDKLRANPLWAVVALPGFSNPFVDPQHWENLRKTLDDRAYRRRVLAQNVGPEQQVYHTFDRRKHLRPIPQIGARDVTAQTLRRFGINFGMLIGHDPGQIQNVSILLKAYRVAGIDPLLWWVVGEFVTKQTTTEQHFSRLLVHLREQHHIQYAAPEEPKALIILDPQSESEARGQPHLSVYRTVRRVGFETRSAAPETHRVPKEARIEMIVRLLEAADGTTRRLFIVPEMAESLLVKSLEFSERDELGEAETARKSDKTKDLSDPTCALGYGLWRLEREKAAA
jgi:hypothetical protein